MEFLKQKVNIYVVITSIIVFILFMIFILIPVSEITENIAPGVESIDTGFVYQIQKFYEIRDAYGEEGRLSYIYLRWTFDVVWPMTYLFFIGSVTLFILKKLKYNSKLVYIIILGTLFDFLENILATIFMSSDSESMSVLIILLMIASSLKWILIYASFILIPVLPLYYLIKPKTS